MNEEERKQIAEILEDILWQTVDRKFGFVYEKQEIKNKIEKFKNGY